MPNHYEVTLLRYRYLEGHLTPTEAAMLARTKNVKLALVAQLQAELDKVNTTTSAIRSPRRSPALLSAWTTTASSAKAAAAG